MAPAVNPHLAAALAQQGNMSPLPYHLPHMLPQAYAQGVIPPVRLVLQSKLHCPGCKASQARNTLPPIGSGYASQHQI